MLLNIILISVVLIIAFAVASFMALNAETQRKERIRQVIQGKTGSLSPKKDGDERDKRRAEIAKKLKDEKEEEDGKKPKASTSLLLEQAGLSMGPKMYWLLSMMLMVALVAMGKFFGYPPYLLLALAVIGLLGLPKFIVKKLAARRQKKFLEEFPDALEATVRLLRAGMPVAEAISMIAREFDGPVGEEMSRVYDKQKIGIPLHEAAKEATVRMPLTEMQMFATGLAIQAQTGSSLSEVLMNLSGVIRARFRLKRKVKALSSEAVASASIIGALPIMVSTGLYFVNYEYLQVLFITPFGNILLTFAVGMMMVGIFVMRVMINFKI